MVELATYNRMIWDMDKKSADKRRRRRWREALLRPCPVCGQVPRVVREISGLWTVNGANLTHCEACRSYASFFATVWKDDTIRYYCEWALNYELMRAEVYQHEKGC